MCKPKLKNYNISEPKTKLFVSEQMYDVLNDIAHDNNTSVSRVTEFLISIYNGNQYNHALFHTDINSYKRIKLSLEQLLNMPDSEPTYNTPIGVTKSVGSFNMSELYPRPINIHTCVRDELDIIRDDNNLWHLEHALIYLIRDAQSNFKWDEEPEKYIIPEAKPSELKAIWIKDDTHTQINKLVNELRFKSQNDLIVYCIEQLNTNTPLDNLEARITSVQEALGVGKRSHYQRILDSHIELELIGDNLFYHAAHDMYFRYNPVSMCFEQDMLITYLVKENPMVSINTELWANLTKKGKTIQ